MDATTYSDSDSDSDSDSEEKGMDEAVFLQLVGGKADPMQLFMEGKMELDGDTDVAMKLGKVLKALKA
eukprot:gene37589-31905_t